MLFNEILMKHRKTHGMTQDELADMLGVSRQSVSKWENGECMPDSEKLIKLSDVLGISLDELIGRDEGAGRITADETKTQKKERPLLAGILITAVLCAAVGAACFLAGRYLAPKSSAVGYYLPETLTAGSFSLDKALADGTWKISFATNTTAAGVVRFYPTDENAEPVEAETCCENGIQTATVMLKPDSRYDRAVFTARADRWERSVAILSDIIVYNDGGSYGDLTNSTAGRFVTTENYTAYLPENGYVVGFEDEDEQCCATELLESVGYPDEDHIVPFDREKTVAEMYAYLIENEPELSADDAARLAEELADRIERIQSALRNNDIEGLEYYLNDDGAMVIDVARLVDGALVDLQG